MLPIPLDLITTELLDIARRRVDFIAGEIIADPVAGYWDPVRREIALSNQFEEVIQRFTHAH